MKGEKIKSSNGLKDLDNSDKINQKAQRELSAPLAINLIPYSDNNSRPGYFELIERRLKEGEVIGIGRLSSKNPSADPNFINLKAKVVSRTHAQIFLRDGKVFLKDVGSSSGTFLNKNRMSPPNKESVAQPLGDGDIIYFGAEYNDKNDGII